MTDDQVRQRIDAYRARYSVKEVNEDGFPVFPAGLRETKQHREWITLYKLFNRSRRRSGQPGTGDGDMSQTQACRVCLQPVRPAGTTHRRCADAVSLVRELGLPSLDRIRAEAFADDSRTGGSVRSRSKGKS